MRELSKKEQKWVGKVTKTLELGGRSKATIHNYIHAINRFLKYHKEDTNFESFTEDQIIDYIQREYIDKNLAGSTYNLNICAIRFLYLVCFDKEFNRKKLPTVKLRKVIPTTIDKPTFIKIFNEEKNIKYKCWLLLGFCSGLRVEEIAQIKISDINSKEHKLKVLGKRKKERFTLLPDITINYLRLYYKSGKFTKNNGYLFEGIAKREYTNSRYITNYFLILRKQYNLPNNMSFHSLRHSFATNFIKAGGDPFVLKSMLGHASFSSTSIYIHMGRDFTNLNGVKYG